MGWCGVCEIELFHMSKNSGNRGLVCKKIWEQVARNDQVNLGTLKSTLNCLQAGQVRQAYPRKKIIHGWYKITMIDDDDYLLLLVLKTGTS